MLVLSRKQEEKLEARITREQALKILARHPFISIKCQVIELRGDRARLGFEAPKEVVIHREEVWGQIEASNCVPAR